MQYMGSKSRFADEIIKTIVKDIDYYTRRDIGNDSTYVTWVEPFVGGANVIDKVNKYCPNLKLIGNDSNFFVISMFQALQKGWIPPDKVSEEEYKELHKLSKTYSPSASTSSQELAALIGFVGVGCSFAVKWFGGYARDDKRRDPPRPYCLQNKNNLMQQKNNIMNVDFKYGDYKELIIPDNSIIYCDPPYANTTKYKTSNFNHNEFWKWCDQMSNNGHFVYVSEYVAPESWKCVWSKKTINNINPDIKPVEKLFTKSA